MIGSKNMIKSGPFGRKKNEFKKNDLICHCFEYTRKNIEKDYLDNGQSMILESIKLEKKTGGCNCTTKNPEGR